MHLELEPVSSNDKHMLYKLTSNIDVMKWVYDSKTWTRDKVIKFIKDCKRNDSLPDNVRDVYSYRISLITPHKRFFCGIVEFKTLDYYKKYKIYDYIKTKFRDTCILTVYILPEYQNKGLLPYIIELIKANIKKHKPAAKYLGFLVMQSNTRMQYTMAKYKIKHIGQAQGYIEINQMYRVPLY